MYIYICILFHSTCHFSSNSRVWYQQNFTLYVLALCFSLCFRFVEVNFSYISIFYFSGVALLPFVDEKRLLHTLQPVYNDLTADEGKSTIVDKNSIQIRQGSTLAIRFAFCLSFYQFGLPHLLTPVFFSLSVRRNRRDINLLFCGRQNSLFDYFVGLYEGNMLQQVC